MYTCLAFMQINKLHQREGGMISTNDLRIYKNVNHLEIYVLVKTKI